MPKRVVEVEIRQIMTRDRKPLSKIEFGNFSVVSELERRYKNQRELYESNTITALQFVDSLKYQINLV